MLCGLKQFCDIYESSRRSAKKELGVLDQKTHTKIVISNCMEDKINKLLLVKFPLNNLSSNVPKIYILQEWLDQNLIIIIFRFDLLKSK